MSAIVRAVSRRHPLAVVATSLAAFSALHLGLAKLLRPMIPLARPKEREGFNWLLASRLTCVCHALLPVRRNESVPISIGREPAPYSVLCSPIFRTGGA